MGKTDIDRRKFLTQSGTALGGLLASPRLGLLAVAAGAIAGAAVETDAPTGGERSLTAGFRRLLRGGEPINGRGEPFGHDISGLAVVPAPAVRPGSRVLVVVGHDEPRTGCEERFVLTSYGLSTVELMRDPAGRWRHEVASDHNRRWDGRSRLALDGARLVSDKPAHRVRSEGEPLGRVASVVATPWETTLACERDGWVVEVNPLSGLCVRRFSLGKLGATSVSIDARGGLPVTVTMRAPGHVFRFVSHQSFDPRRPQANQSILLIGELSVFDGESWLALTEGAGPGEWERLARDPYADPRVPVALPEERVAAVFGAATAVSASSPDGGARFSAARDELGCSLVVTGS